jgi:hypothetical protein
MSVHFSGKSVKNSEGEISFEATFQSNSFICKVTSEALQDIDPSNRFATPEDQFNLNRATFESIAGKKIRVGATSPVLITTADLVG